MLWRILLAIGDAAPLADARFATDEAELVLVRRFGQKDGRAACEVYARYADRVYRFLYRRLGERVQDAEDLTLETFTAAIDLAGSFDGRSSVFVWLCGIARIRLIDFHRKESRIKRTAPNGVSSLDALGGEKQQEPADPSETLEALLNRISAKQLVDSALYVLTSEERDALTLHYVEEFSLKEIAGHLGRTEKAVKSLLGRAKVKLREILIASLPEELLR